MRKALNFLTLTTVFAVLAPSSAFADPIQDLASKIERRAGSASEDRRGSTKILGAQVDCPGDTLEASVRITKVSGRLDGDTARMSVDYQGEYTRQGWGGGCNRLPGRETGTVSGTYSFSVTGKAFQKPTIVWGSGSAFGKISSDPGHDSNIFALRAVQDAVNSAF